MNHLLDDVEDEDRSSRRDREITLGTTTLLGIFFALAILCAGFFGFGYSMGSKHTTVAAITPNGDPVILRNISGSKPSPGNPYAAPQTPQSKTSGDAEAASAAPVPVTTRTVVLPPPGATAPAEAFEVTDPPASSKAPKVSSLPAPAPTPALITAAPAAPTGQQFVVQVAALTHQEDAELIQTTLQRRGYTVVVRQDAIDHLLHVQVGPFGTRKDAEAMRQRLIGDGFNAYIK